MQQPVGSPLQRVVRRREREGRSSQRKGRGWWRESPESRRRKDEQWGKLRGKGGRCEDDTGEQEVEEDGTAFPVFLNKLCFPILIGGDI